MAGEVLIDLISQGSKSKAIVGGGPANTSMALARLGVDTFFIDSMSLIAKFYYGPQNSTCVDLEATDQARRPTH